MRRVAAVVLPSFRLALVRARDPSVATGPLAVVVSRDATERDLTGGKRVDDVSDDARALGVSPGVTIASAKAKCAELRVRVLRPDEATRALEGLAEMLLGFGALTAPLFDRDAVVVDVTGCAHLHGGERETLAAIARSVARAGFSCRAALASGPEIAWAFARHAARPGVVAPDETARALGELPIDAMRLDPRTASYFRKLGVGTIDAMRALPRDALTARMENENLLARVRALLDGDDGTPIPRFSPAIVLEERAELEYGVENVEALAFVLKALCDRMGARLEGRCALAARLEVDLEMDRAMCAGDATARVSLPLASPVRKSEELLSVLRARFESVHELRAPVLAVVLRAPETTLAEPRARHLFVPESRAEIALPKLAAELGALLGEGALGTLAVADDWRAERRSVLVPFGAKRPPSASFGDVEPLRLVPSASSREPALEDVVHLARFERVAWWTDAPAPADWKLARTSDALVLVEVDAQGHARVRGVLD